MLAMRTQVAECKDLRHGLTSFKDPEFHSLVYLLKQNFLYNKFIRVDTALMVGDSVII